MARKRPESLARVSGTRSAKGGVLWPVSPLPIALAVPPRRCSTPSYATISTSLAHARDTYEAPLPRYVEQELRGYLRCGVFAHGFVRAYCDRCGHDLLVAFSCKARTACPSCAGRRMANIAAHLVDRVLPAVPVRQWVLSLPFELRALAAFRADVLSARLLALPSGATAHARGAGRGRATRAPARTRVAWKKQTPRRDIDGGRITGAEQTSLDACDAIAMQRGAVRALRDDPDAEQQGGGLEAPPRTEGAVERDGFNLHASVSVPGNDDLGANGSCATVHAPRSLSTGCAGCPMAASHTASRSFETAARSTA